MLAHLGSLRKTKELFGVFGLIVPALVVDHLFVGEEMPTAQVGFWNRVVNDYDGR